MINRLDFRIALQANEKIEERMPIYIVPFGIEYGNFFRFRSSLLVEIGEPINVTSYIKANSTLSVAEQINGLKDLLTDGLKGCICYIPDNEDYDSLLTLCQVCSETNLSKQNKKKSLNNRLIENKFILEKINSLKTTDSQKASALIAKSKEININLIKKENLLVNLKSML